MKHFSFRSPSNKPVNTAVSSTSLSLHKTIISMASLQKHKI